MWPRAVSAALGIWLMAAPAVLGYGGVARDHDHIVGPIVVTIAVTAMAAVMRPLRRLNSAIAAWLLLGAPWLLSFPPSARASTLIVGVILLGASLVRGGVEDEFGGGWRAIWKGDR
ncbi:MAG: SPW repeat domain-containing protein [Gemmatimonadaceae bacterium]